MIASGAPSSGPQLLAILNAMEAYEARFGKTPRDVAFMRNVSTVSYGVYYCSSQDVYGRLTLH